MSLPVISVVVPAYNEEENLPVLFERIVKTLSDFGRPFEIVFVNDASIDSTKEVLAQIAGKREGVMVLDLLKNSGKAVALEQGFAVARGTYIVIIDADLQQNPEDIPRLIEKIDEGYDVVSGKRANRSDAPGKVMTSRLFNRLMRLVTGLCIEDYFSGLKAFRADVIRFLSLYGDLYRFASVFAYKEGFRVTEISCSHHARAHGDSKYSSLARFRLALRDLLTVMFSVTLSRKRVYALGIVSLLCLSVSLTLTAAACYQYGLGPELFQTASGFLGLFFFFLGGQGLIIKKLADDFFVRHYGQFRQRQKIVRRVV